MLKNKKLNLLLFVSAGILVCIVIFMGLTGPVYINSRPVTGVSVIDKAGEEYLRQYPDNTRFFKDQKLEKKYINTKCTVQSDIPLFIIKLFDINLKGKITYQGKGGLSIKNVIIHACRDVNAEYETSPVNASAVYNKKKRHYVLKRGQNGKKTSLKKITAAYYNNKLPLDLTPDTIEPDVTDEKMQSIIDKANEKFRWHINYSKNYTVRYPADHIKIKNSKIIIVPYNFHDELIKLDELYNTSGEKKTVKLHNGKKYISNKGTWGDLTDSKREREYLQNAFDNGKSVNRRKPVMKKIKPGLIIEVDKKRQHVWAYTKAGRDVMDSDCVTGKKGVHDTPKGIFYISQVSKDYTMKGDGYTSFCRRFMRITNTGVALHDAPWRSRFGGSIYTYNGSHGCINLPSAFALKLADKVRVDNTMVIVH